MATTQLVPVSEYLRTMYRPDVDYVDGELQERLVGERDHSDLQSFFDTYINMHRAAWGLRATVELRVQVRADRFRIPDVCVLDPAAPREQIVQTPPLLCIEVLSPEDTIARVRMRIRDFLDMGVREVWVVDPASRVVMIYSGNGMIEQTEGRLVLAGTPLAIPIAEAFRALDEE